MPREVDLRDDGQDHATPERRAALRDAARRVSELLPGDRRVTVARYDPLTGNPALIRVTGAGPPVDGPPLPGLPPVGGTPVERALAHVRTLAPVLGLTVAQVAELSPGGLIETTSGAGALHLEQSFLGIPVFGAGVTVRFSPAGIPGDLAGRTVSLPDVPPTRAPGLTVQEAFRAAVVHLVSNAEAPGDDAFGQPLPAVDFSDLLDRDPEVLARLEDRPDLRTVLGVPGRSQAATAGLTWFPMGTELRLGWSLQLSGTEDGAGTALVVDATDGTVLYCCGPEEAS